MYQALIAFAQYWVVATLILGIFVYIYTKLTPYDELREIRDGNRSPAVTFSGALLGFAFPILAVIYNTGSLLEMTVWAITSAMIQLVIFFIMSRIFHNRLMGFDAMAPAIVVATISVVFGLLTAACITP